jgi:hypothetical protein
MRCRALRLLARARLDVNYSCMKQLTTMGKYDYRIVKHCVYRRPIALLAPHS